MGCNNTKPAQPVAKKEEPTKDPAPAQEAPKAEEPKAVETKPVEDKSAHKLLPGDAVQVTKGGGFEGTVVRSTTTDVLVKSDGKEEWHDIEDVQHGKVQQKSPPPLDKEVVVGAAVSTVEGLTGTVVKRTTTDCYLKTEDGAEVSCGIDDIVAVRLSIVKATGLRKADTISKSDPYVVCQIEGRPTTVQTVQTPWVLNNQDPEWNYEATLLGFQLGDSLNFTIWDKDVITKDDFLGTATLSSDKFLENDFYGELSLTDKAGQAAQGVLTVRVVVQPKPTPPPPPAQTQDAPPPEETPKPPEVEVLEVKQKPTGWCC